MYSEAITRAPIVVFLGAGASKSLGMPLMADFVSGIQEDPDLVARPLHKALLSKDTDLEHVLEELDQLSGKAYVDAAYGKLRLADRIKNSNDPNYRATASPGDYFGQTATQAREITQILRKKIFETYASIKEPPKLLHIFTPFLDGLFTNMYSSKSPLVIFTTNYDPAIEMYAGLSSPYYALSDGFRTDASEGAIVWDRKVFDTYSLSEGTKQLVLFKLHGSTRWSRVRNLIAKIPFDQFADVNAPHQNVLIYPAKTKIALEDPFFTAYDYFQRTLDLTKLVISIGYSFRDYDALTKLKTASLFNPELTVLVVDPKAQERCAMLQENGIRTVALEACFGEDVKYLGTVWENVTKALSNKR